MNEAERNSMMVLEQELRKKEYILMQVRQAQEALKNFEKRVMRDALKGELKDNYVFISADE